VTARPFSELAVAFTLLALAVLLVNPWGLWMPDAVVMAGTAGVLAAFAAYASFVWRERARDEREEQHRLVAGRLAFLTGAAVLVVGLAMQSLRHDVDPWLAAALAAMVVVKAAARLYSEWSR
jgi:putative flippase GtrA